MPQATEASGMFLFCISIRKHLFFQSQLFKPTRRSCGSNSNLSMISLPGKVSGPTHRHYFLIRWSFFFFFLTHNTLSYQCCCKALKSRSGSRLHTGVRHCMICKSENTFQGKILGMSAQKKKKKKNSETSKLKETKRVTAG